MTQRRTIYTDLRDDERCTWVVGDERCQATIPDGSAAPYCVTHSRAAAVRLRRLREVASVLARREAA